MSWRTGRKVPGPCRPTSPEHIGNNLCRSTSVAAGNHRGETMTTLLDLSAIKFRQQKTWASGDYPAFAARIHPISELLVTAADLPAGARVLDIATGSGNAAIAAARC